MKDWQAYTAAFVLLFVLCLSTSLCLSAYRSGYKEGYTTRTLEVQAIVDRWEEVQKEDTQLPHYVKPLHYQTETKTLKEGFGANDK